MRQQSEMRPYQDRFATFLYEHDQAFCLGRPGAGKTVGALTAFLELKRDGVARHLLVLAPKRVARSVWPDEVAEWAHLNKLTYAVLKDGPAKRNQLLASADKRDITIVGLDVIDWLLDELEKYPDDHPVFDLLCIDEISRLREPTGTRVKYLKKKTKRWKMRWGLSGTLRPNSQMDLFMPALLITNGGLWGTSFYKWQKANFYATDFQGFQWSVLPGGTEQRLNDEIAPYITTVADGEMPKHEPIVVLDYVDLPPDVRRDYITMEKKLLVRGETEEKNIVAGSTAIATGKLAQLANGHIFDNDGTVHHAHDEKKNWFKDVVENATGPVLCFYEYVADLDMMRSVLGADLPYLGQGVSDKDSDAYIRDWNAGKIPFLAAHPYSAAHGLNLQHGGSDMVWEQGLARLARSGQKNTVVVRVCVARNTVDELKLSRVHFKMSEQEAFEAYLRSRQFAVAA
jgi:SNF2 family DNA or RNA helicase